jgi:hypothetical protein
MPPPKEVLMGSYFRRVRFAILFVLLFAIGRLVLGATGVPYATGTHILSIVTFSFFASLFFGAFSRSAWGYRWGQAMMLGITIGLSGQILIFLATLGSYLAGAETYFNNPIALVGPGANEVAIPLVQAMVARLIGLVVNPILNSIAALIGWSLGKLVPEKG